MNCYSIPELNGRSRLLINLFSVFKPPLALVLARQLEMRRPMPVLGAMPGANHILYPFWRFLYACSISVTHNLIRVKLACACVEINVMEAKSYFGVLPVVCCCPGQRVHFFFFFFFFGCVDAVIPKTCVCRVL